MKLTLRRQRPTRHPTPQQARDAALAGLCIYAPISVCSGLPAPMGLRHKTDTTKVIVCRAHYGRLHRLNGRELDSLERANA